MDLVAYEGIWLLLEHIGTFGTNGKQKHRNHWFLWEMAVVRTGTPPKMGGDLFASPQNIPK